MKNKKQRKRKERKSENYTDTQHVHVSTHEIRYWWLACDPGLAGLSKGANPCASSRAGGGIGVQMCWCGVDCGFKTGGGGGASFGADLSAMMGGPWLLVW
jgi:hypothetical protein